MFGSLGDSSDPTIVISANYDKDGNRTSGGVKVTLYTYDEIYAEDSPFCPI